MGSDSESQLAEQDKLRGAENYHQWADEIDNILRAKGLKSYINESLIQLVELLSPTDPLTETLAEAARRAARILEIVTWELNDAKTLVAIQRNLTQQPKDLVRGIKAAPAMWMKLKKHYEGKGHSLKSQYVTEI